MIKRLGIVTSSNDVGNEYKDQLLKIFNYDIEIVTYSFNMDTREKMENLDVLLISTYSQYEVLKKYIESSVDVVICSLTLSKKGYNVLKNNTLKRKAGLVNISFEMCIETIATLYQLGFDDYELIPVYPNMDVMLDLDYAITTGENSYVPKSIKHVMDLGHRVIDKNTIVDLAIALNKENILTQRWVLDYFNSIISYSRGYDYFISQSKISKNQFNTLLSIMDKGVIHFNNLGIIQSYNKSARDIVNPTKELSGINMSEVIPGNIIKEYLSKKEQVLNKLINLKGENVTISIIPIGDMGLEGSNCENIHGSYIILENFERQEETQNKIRLQLSNKGHVAKYGLENIIGESDVICQVKSLVRRMANSKSSVLIIGESGTGKELIAQAIHKASPISDKQFVAINCAALSPNLLESELFGYEAGAFTGASKNGKPGIFELAHNGTLFLDEIGEMPLELQVRLLRVIQEQEVMRVGGNKIIKVNVRLVAATNRDLYNQVKEGKFRKDLYYRLNVLPINIPPLRERRDDFELLIEYFKSLGGYDYEISEEVLAFFKNYNWDGNIRELRNCVEYFENLGTSIIEISQLPSYMKEQMKETIDYKDVFYDGLNEKESYVIKQFYEAFKNKRKIGRRSLSDAAYADNVFLSEYDIRSILKDLKNLGYIDVGLGRGGSTITKKGIELVNKEN